VAGRIATEECALSTCRLCVHCFERSTTDHRYIDILGSTPTPSQLPDPEFRFDLAAVLGSSCSGIQKPGTYRRDTSVEIERTTGPYCVCARDVSRDTSQSVPNARSSH
jgi:hypothetical protein